MAPAASCAINNRPPVVRQKLDRLAVCLSLALTCLNLIVDQRFIAKINQHGMVLVIKPVAKNIETPISRPS